MIAGIIGRFERAEAVIGAMQAEALRACRLLRKRFFGPHRTCWWRPGAAPGIAYRWKQRYYSAAAGKTCRPVSPGVYSASATNC